MRERWERQKEMKKIDLFSSGKKKEESMKENKKSIPIADIEQYKSD
jgi:hypothetical protein